MRRILKIGLTGGIGAGKSAALAGFRRLGAETVSLDEIARVLSRKGGPGCRAAARALGRGVLAGDGELDRRAIAARVFRDASARRRLERAIHPLIRREMRRRISACGKPYVVVDAPLLFEGGLDKEFDVTLLVSAGRKRRIERVRRRDGVSRADVLRRMAAQMPEKRRRALADVIVSNEGGLGSLGRKIAGYDKAFRLIAGGRP